MSRKGKRERVEESVDYSAIREENIRRRQEFLSSLDPDEVLMLLKMKSSGFLAEECHALGLHKVNGYEKRHE
jgi:hypothetical protein